MTMRLLGAQSEPGKGKTSTCVLLIESCSEVQTLTLAHKQIPQRRQAACQPCRMRKIKCDKKKPSCNICVAGGQECEYLNEATDKLTYVHPRRPIH